MVKSVQTTFGSRNWPGKFAQKAVADLSNSKALASVLLLEGSVLTGRCYHAQKRGGFVELRERFIEEFLTGIVWLFGITSLNKVGNFVAKKFNFDTTIDVGKDKISEEYGKLKDHFKSPLERFTDGKSKRFKDILSRVKFSKIILCTLTGIYVVGSMIPKYKNSVTENDKKNQGQKGFAAALTGVFEDKFAKKQAQKTTNSDSFSMQKFLETAKNSSTNFKGGLNLVSLSHNLENNNIYKILTMDAGIIGGRSINSRNEDEKYEIVLRDVCSIYFYMASTHHISHFLSDDKFNFFGKKNATGLNLDKRMGVSTNLDPRIAEYLNNQILKEFDTTSKSKEGFNYEKFMTGIFGKEQPDLVKILKHEAETQKEKHTLNLDNFLKILEDHSYENIDFIRRNAKNAAKLNNQLITGSGVMRIARHLEELKTDKQVAEQLKILPGDTIEVKRLKKLPELFLKASDMLYKHTANGKEIHSVSNKIIIKMIDDLAKLNLSINNEKLRKLHKEEMDIVAKFKEEHLKQVKSEGNFIVAAQIEDIVNDGLIRKQGFLNEAFSISNPNVKNPRKYVPLSSFNETKDNIRRYSECLKENLDQYFKEKGNITVKDLEKALKKFQYKNLKMKALYTSIGLAASAYFLSSGIPRFQYYMTKKRTGSNEFPGIKGLNKT